ncbi:MAG: thioredoxin family protein [Sphingomonadaceae bacterium]|nr:thioredoxin family protein [Sphingomonadaceae bacterium]
MLSLSKHARPVALALLLAIPASFAVAAATPPRVTATMAALAQPLPLPYDETADAAADVAAAKARAAKAHKLLLIDLGGNWCPDCRVLAGVLALPAVKAFVDRHYAVVSVDIGRRDKNLDIAARYGADVKGVPAVLIVDPATDRLKNPGHFAALSDARHMTPQALADWLAGWV